MESDISAYTAFHQSDSMDRTDRAKWVLDSGATKHMCGDRTLFGSLKRFAEPEQVKLADHSTILAYGKGQIELRSGAGRNVSLREAWYVPELHTVKLVLIMCLNGHGIELVFRPGRTVEARKEGRVIFTGSTQSGLVCLDLEPQPLQARLSKAKQLRTGTQHIRIIRIMQVFVKVEPRPQTLRLIYGISDSATLAKRLLDSLAKL
jgi:hypothetical protein